MYGSYSVSGHKMNGTVDVKKRFQVSQTAFTFTRIRLNAFLPFGPLPFSISLTNCS